MIEAIVNGIPTLISSRPCLDLMEDDLKTHHWLPIYVEDFCLSDLGDEVTLEHRGDRMRWRLLGCSGQEVAGGLLLTYREVRLLDLKHCPCVEKGSDGPCV